MSYQDRVAPQGRKHERRDARRRARADRKAAAWTMPATDDVGAAASRARQSAAAAREQHRHRNRATERPAQTVPCQPELEPVAAAGPGPVELCAVGIITRAPSIERPWAAPSHRTFRGFIDSQPAWSPSRSSRAIGEVTVVRCPCGNKGYVSNRILASGRTPVCSKCGRIQGETTRSPPAPPEPSAAEPRQVAPQPAVQPRRPLKPQRRGKRQAQLAADQEAAQRRSQDAMDAHRRAHPVIETWPPWLEGPEQAVTEASIPNTEKRA